MPLEDLVAAVGLAGVMVYAVLGGADFGGGIWDLFATGPRRDQQRSAIAHAMGPVWEANHVWLIFVIVVLFTGFPSAYAELSIRLFALFHLVLIGITLRGAAFVFRAYSSPQGQTPRHWGTVFGASSVITPVLLGMALGIVSASNGSSLAVMPLTMGVFALALCAYLAAVYLTNETTGPLQEDFRHRALLAGTVVVALSVLVLPLLFVDARHLWDGLLSWRAAPILVAGVAFALLSGWSLLRRRYRMARLATIVQVSLLLAGWGLAQYPYVIYPDMKLHDARAPDATLWFVLIAVPIGMLVLVPSLWLLFRVFKGTLPPAHD